MWKLAGMVLALVFSVGAAEEPKVTVGEWLTSMDQSEQEIWFAISGKSLDAANEYLKFKSQPPLFCIPPELDFNGTRYRSLFIELIKQHPEIASKDATEFEPFLLIALRNAFQCPSSK
ncbi:hypothetical protein DFR52_102515 [Hoeflea marina]|uniref:Rap1a immunity protein domain-containing protein n=2 Tax=Hoeflea marina TaxID=274592 RepID=A0A317PNL3_9HYPH|nr:hypothetical protein DFR52_102515 [Hoeflea marina]